MNDPDQGVPGRTPRDPVADLRRIAFLLERTLQSGYRVKAFRGAAATLARLDGTDVARHAAAGTLTTLPGVGDTTARVVAESVSGRVPQYLAELEATSAGPLATGGESLRALLRGDCHSHSDWSDGGSPIEEMALTARDLGHQYQALTDHSPRLTVARGLTAERLRRQLGIVRGLGERLTPFRLLTGIEVDILEDGALDQSGELLAELDVTVASVHSKLRMDSREMTARMLSAVRNPHTDILGHCTGRYVVGKPRPESQFDAEAVFAACAEHGVAVEVNSRPERLDPPRRLLRRAIELGCLLSVDTDAHAPGQLDWQQYGCARAVECGANPASVVNTWPVEDLLAWTRDHRHRPATR
ncbi:MAG TPA: PHP domain-containing protein [Kineosporiaceae bacterium]|nr:PHP domain-containing protein [Kineosporiaceae bacterium]